MVLTSALVGTSSFWKDRINYNHFQINTFPVDKVQQSQRVNTMNHGVVIIVTIWFLFDLLE